MKKYKINLLLSVDLHLFHMNVCFKGGKFLRKKKAVAKHILSDNLSAIRGFLSQYWDNYLINHNLWMVQKGMFLFSKSQV